MTITQVSVDKLTEATLEGKGVYDVLMRATKAHLEQEYKQNRIRGPEYSTVYLGAMEGVLNAAVQFLLQNQKAELEAKLIEQQILLTQAEVDKAQAQVLLIKQQTENALAEHALITQNADKIAAEIRNLDANTALTQEQTRKVPLETIHLEKQTALVIQQTSNALVEGDVLKKQGCKLDAEFDVLQATKLKVSGETGLLNQKISTEKAQTVGAGVDPDSVIGKQKQLYQAQADGFIRDAEQSTAKIMADTWMARRTTDEATQANPTNRLDDASVGRAINKLLQGIGA